MNADFVIAEGDILYARVDLGIYSATALLKVAHRFTDRCFLHLQTEADGSVGVRFRTKRPNTDRNVLAGDFMNELLDQTLREEVARETEPVRNLILAHALSETTLLRPELDSIDPAEDPYGIGKPDSSKSPAL